MDGGRLFLHKIHTYNKDTYRLLTSLLSPSAIGLNQAKRHPSVITVKVAKEEFFAYIVSAYLTVELPLKIERIAREHYYYTDPIEIERIIEYTNCLLQDACYVKQWFKARSLFAYLYKNIHDHFMLHAPTSIYIQFETFVRFQFKTFHQQLIDIVGEAIDEMKREEEYQYFIEKLRRYIQHAPPKCRSLHIVQAEPFRFYTEYGTLLNRSFLRKKMAEAPLYLFGLDEHEWNLSPIIALLPEKLYIYGRNENEGKTVTLLSIFEERARFLSEDAFQLPGIKVEE